MKKSLASTLILGGAFALTASSHAAVTLLVNDTFTGGTGADIATYPRWSGDGVGDLSYTQPTDAFRVTYTGSTTADRIFSRSFTETTLGAGDSLSLTFDFTPGAGNSIYRLGLFDVGTAATITDGFLGQSANSTIGKDGYYTMFGSNTFGGAVRRETVASGAVMGGGTNLTTAPLSAPTTTFAGTLVSVVFTLTNTGTSAAPVISFVSELHSGAGGTGSIIYTMSGTQSTSALNKFDNIIFYNGGTQMTLDNVKLTYTTAAVPEPGSFAAIAGVAALGAMGLRRKRRSV